jgi:hypothetical protein
MITPAQSARLHVGQMVRTFHFARCGTITKVLVPENGERVLELEVPLSGGRSFKAWVGASQIDEVL